LLHPKRFFANKPATLWLLPSHPKRRHKTQHRLVIAAHHHRIRTSVINHQNNSADTLLARTPTVSTKHVNRLNFRVLGSGYIGCDQTVPSASSQSLYF